uniref:Uncharacterized protein n=1 Tax=Corvus moneduloides TaxID=1196302 RepID=A0A8U7NBG2_CORMO
MWYPRSQSSQNSSWSWAGQIPIAPLPEFPLFPPKSLSRVPQVAKGFYPPQKFPPPVSQRLWKGKSCLQVIEIQKFFPKKAFPGSYGLLNPEGFSPKNPSSGNSAAFPGGFWAFQSNFGAFPGNFGALPGNFGALPGNFGALPGNFGAFPGNFGAFPGNFGAFPGNFGALPGNFGALPGNFGAFPGNFGAFPGNFGAFPGNFGALPGNFGALTSFSEVPQMLQHLHSMHCQRYVFTAAIITGVNCRHDG